MRRLDRLCKVFWDCCSVRWICGLVLVSVSLSLRPSPISRCLLESLPLHPEDWSRPRWDKSQVDIHPSYLPAHTISFVLFSHIQNLYILLLTVANARSATIIFFLWRHFTKLHDTDKEVKKLDVEKEKKELEKRIREARKAGASSREVQGLQMDLQFL